MARSTRRSACDRGYFAGQLLLAVLLLIGTSGAGAQEVPELAFEHYTLDNGLQVVLHEDHTIPTVAVNIWYHVGSKNERPGRTGFAHLLEHMMFEGSEHHNDAFDKPLLKVGGRDSAKTLNDVTFYWEDVPADQLELALWLESDRMGYLLPAMTSERLANQKDVVSNEIRQGLNAPYFKAEVRMIDLLYPDEHPYSWPVSGSLEDVSAASLDDVSELFRSYYTPNNASLCIAGDFDPKQARELVAKYFAPIPPGPPVTHLKHWVPELDGIRRAVVEDVVELPRLYVAWHTPGLYQPGDAAGRLLATVLGTGKTSRLYQRLVYELQIAQEVFVYSSDTELSSFLLLVATARPGHSLDELEEAVDAELVRLQEQGVTEAELQLAQAQVETEHIRALQRTGGFGGKADLLNRYTTFLGDPGYLTKDLQAYQQATTDDLQQLARRYLPLDRRVIVHAVPQGDVHASGEEPDRSKMPASSGAVEFHPPQIQRATLSNGLELYLVERHELPLVEVDLFVLSGWSADPVDRPGAAALTAKLLDEGTGSRTALQISEEARRIGARLSTGSSSDGSQIRLNLLRHHLDEGLELVADILLHPTFPEEELERQRSSSLAQIRQEASWPTAAAVKTLQRLVFGSTHPYAQPYTGSGTVASIQALTRNDLIAFYRAHYLPNNTAAVVVGDLSLAEASARLERVLASWQPGEVSRPPVPPVEQNERGRLFLIDRPGAPQSMIAAGEPGLPRNHPDLLAFNVMNSGLGGQLVSRLNMNLREDKGYAYGINSGTPSFREAGLFFIAGAVETQHTGESLVEILKEINDIKEARPFTPAELKDIIDGMSLRFPQRFQTYDAIASQLGTLVLFQQPLDDWQTYTERVGAVDAAAVSRVVAEHLQPEKLTFVIIGDVAKIKDGLQKLRLGEITILDPEELLR